MKKMVLPVLLLTGLAASGCSGDFSIFGDDEPSAAPTAAESIEAQPTSQFELRFVNPTAPPCASVWAPGQRLPVNYEWCVADDGTPIAGPRIGSCEVVTYDNQYYAIPGYRIRTANGVMSQDRAYQRALTSCKRDPAP